MASSPFGADGEPALTQISSSRDQAGQEGQFVPSQSDLLDEHNLSTFIPNDKDGPKNLTSSSTVRLPFSMESDSDNDSDLDVRRPVGRAARRMQSGDQGSPQSHTSSPPRRQRSPSNMDHEQLYSATPRRPMLSYDNASFPLSAARSTLFVSPARTTQDDSDNELPTRPRDMKARLAALVAEKRSERLERESEEERERMSSGHASSDLPEEIIEGSQDAGDPEIERIMSDAAKPTRKASKKALLEMERETQRIARQQALAHQMKTKKKFTTNDLFARFNFRPAGQTISPQKCDIDNAASSAPSSDAMEAPMREPVSTPPSSPPTPLDRQRALVEQGALSKLVPVREDSLHSIVEADEDEELPDLADTLASSRTANKAATESIVAQPSETGSGPKKGLKLARLGKKAMAPSSDDDSEDDLEIVKELPHHLAIFDRARGAMKKQHGDAAAIHRLKYLAHIGLDDSRTARRKNGKARPSVNPQALEVQLRLRAREQARIQQLERIAELKAKGIEVQTAEEREREQEAFENLLEKARQDAVALRKAERAADKDESGAVASGDESEDEEHVDASGSEDDSAGGESQDNDLVNDLADEEGEEDEEDEDEGDEEADEEEQEEGEGNEEAQAEQEQEGTVQAEEPQTSIEPVPAETPVIGGKFRRSRVVMEDDDDDDDKADTAHNPPPVNHTPQSEEDPFAAFGFDAARPGSSLMSPTQMFNATMQTPTQVTQQDSLDALNYLVPPSSSSHPPPTFNIATQNIMHSQGDSQVSVVPGSQLPQSQQVNLAWETQAPETPVLGSNKAGSSTTLDTPGWEPSQDGGLPATFQATPSLRREDTNDPLLEHETQSTLRLRISESPAAPPKRTRLVRGQRPVLDDSEDEDEDEDVEAPTAAKIREKDAFREMARKRKEALTAAELAEAEREAKQMMDEQAEESEDEYAGLGGDDFVAPETAEDREMIDSSHVDVNERELAAHFAERQRAADEAEASKLYKDLMTGALRRKQANMFDLDEDEDDLAVRRRQMRQREEARKRKLLLQDDNIAGLAEGRPSKGKDAFLKAIADDDERDEDTFDLSEPGEDEPIPGSQEESQPTQQPIQPLTEVSGNKRRLDEEPAERPPAKLRRKQVSAFRAPTSLLELKESVSFLLEEPHMPLVGPSAMELSSDSEKEDGQEEQNDEDNNDGDDLEQEAARENDGGFAPDRIAMPPPRVPASMRRTAAKPAVVDRLTLKRASSASESAQGRTAWAAPANGGFKTPSLLRRATTSNSAYGANERGVSTSNGLSRENSGGVKIGGSKKSSLAYQARDAERKAIVEQSAKRRAENTAKIAQLRRNASSGFGKGLSGKFE